VISMKAFSDTHTSGSPKAARERGVSALSALVLGHAGVAVKAKTVDQREHAGLCP
jgi:hypothetical protein